jgi:cobalt-zinc-cadmium efflux system protein
LASKALTSDLIRRIEMALFLTISAMGLELAGGLLSGSLALLSDAGHMGTDAVAFSIALWTIRTSTYPHTYRYTYGYHRAEILGAFVNGVALGSVSLTIMAEAVGRLLVPLRPNADLALTIAVVGLGLNSLVLVIMRQYSATSLGAKGAFLHALSDSFGSLGAIAGNLLVKITGFAHFDGLLALAIGLGMMYYSVRLVLDSASVLLEGAPSKIDAKAVDEAIRSIAGVKSIHDLHIWTIGSELYALTCHVVVEDQSLSRAAELLAKINDMLRKRFGIAHITIQLDAGQGGVELRGLREA